MRKGFALIELLIVIIIIVLLSLWTLHATLGPGGNGTGQTNVEQGQSDIQAAKQVTGRASAAAAPEQNAVDNLSR